MHRSLQVSLGGPLLHLPPGCTRSPISPRFPSESPPSSCNSCSLVDRQKTRFRNSGDDAAEVLASAAAERSSIRFPSNVEDVSASERPGDERSVRCRTGKCSDHERDSRDGGHVCTPRASAFYDEKMTSRVVNGGGLTRDSSNGSLGFPASFIYEKESLVYIP